MLKSRQGSLCGSQISLSFSFKQPLSSINTCEPINAVISSTVKPLDVANFLKSVMFMLCAGKVPAGFGTSLSILPTKNGASLSYSTIFGPPKYSELTAPQTAITSATDASNLFASASAFFAKITPNASYLFSGRDNSSSVNNIEPSAPPLLRAILKES